MNEYYFYIVNSLHLMIVNGLTVTLMVIGILVIIFCVYEFCGTYPIDEHEMQRSKLIFKYIVITLMVLSLLNIFVPSGDVVKIMLGN